eukprot:TRINITY_DN4419_c2_g1_i1.p1 TRINITY_DN4419_c2_g1~~TRINITY_DN4419_c2_g1_i1.p1  ORF type:complete len:854 (+),score=268.69 TRINITY_DN4419_c2_g1_i1:120-2681(+)
MSHGDESYRALVTSDMGDDEGAPAPRPSAEQSAASRTSKILVAVRVRPLLQREMAAGHCRIIKVMGERLVILKEKRGMATRRGSEASHASAPAYNLKARKPREKRYVFDHAFSDDTPQDTLYNITTASLVDSVLQGYNGTVFAYGATGSGKTHTMIGNEQEPGTMFLTLQDLLRKARAMQEDQALKFKLTLSYLEIYNELIRDLMKPEQPPLELREHPDKGMRVAGITEFRVDNIDEMMELLLIGNENRTTEPTEANDQSSRSHAVLQIHVEQHDTSRNQIKTAKLNMIDLAGSERGCVSQNRGARLIEGGNINRSLLALGNCINALSSAAKEKGGGERFVPYRDSKLTRLLKDSLGGNCHTVMITTVSPSHTAMEESTNTLKYATRAKKIKNYVVCNEKTVSYHVSRYERVIEDLQGQVAALRLKLDQAPTAPAGGGHIATADGAARREYEVLKRSILFNYNEQRRVRRQMGEVHELQLQLFLKISTAQTQADERRLLGDYAQTSEAATARIIDDATRKIRKNEKLRSALKDKVVALEQESAAITARVNGADGGVACREMRELLAQDLAMRQLELEYQELEGRKDMQDQLVEGKNVLIKRLKLHVSLRDAVISHQRAVLQQHGVAPEALQRSYTLIDSLEHDPHVSSAVPPPSAPSVDTTPTLPALPRPQPQPSAACPVPTGRGGMPVVNSATVSSNRNYAGGGGSSGSGVSIPVGGLSGNVITGSAVKGSSDSFLPSLGGRRKAPEKPKGPSVAALSAALQHRSNAAHPKPAAGDQRGGKHPSPLPQIARGANSGAALRRKRQKQPEGCMPSAYPTRPGYTASADLGIKALGAGLQGGTRNALRKFRQQVR